MRFGVIFAAAAAVAGFVSPAQAGACNFEAARPWAPFKGLVFRSEAYSNGQKCDGAVATIVLRDAKGHVLWTDAMAVEHLMTFVTAKAPNKMRAALSEWLAQRHSFRSSADLPAWSRGAESPSVVGEFPFYAAEGMDQAAYEEIRAQRLPMFCYVQGMESLSCVAVARDGSATKVGVQSFPG